MVKEGLTQNGHGRVANEALIVRWGNLDLIMLNGIKTVIEMVPAAGLDLISIQTGFS